MSTEVSKELQDIQRRIETLCDRYKRDEDFQNGLNFAVSGIEQALGAAQLREAPKPAKKAVRR